MTDNKMKKCKICGIEKDYTSYKIINNKYYSSKCRDCYNLKQKTQAKDTYSPDKRRERYLKNKDKYLPKYVEYRKKNIDSIREKDRKRKNQAQSQDQDY